jgi:hypothetical protein
MHTLVPGDASGADPSESRPLRKQTALESTQYYKPPEQEGSDSPPDTTESELALEADPLQSRVL